MSITTKPCEVRAVGSCPAKGLDACAEGPAGAPGGGAGELSPRRYVRRWSFLTLLHAGEGRQFGHL